MLRRVLFVLLGMVVVLATVLGVAWATGRAPRDYPVLAPGTTVGTSGLTAAQVAAAHLPSVVEAPGEGDPPLERIWWDVEPVGSGFRLRYYLVWPTEHHPNPALDAAYALWRAAYYGLADIEVVTVDLDASGAVRAVSMDAAEPGAGYRTATPVHVPRTWDLPAATGRIGVCVRTWNHLLEVCDAPRAAADPPSAPLDDGTFADQKLLRRR